MAMPKMERISIEQAKTICMKKGLKPGKVKGTTDAVQFTKGRNARIETISWEQFESLLSRKKLAIYNWKGYMKLGKK